MPTITSLADVLADAPHPVSSLLKSSILAMGPMTLVSFAILTALSIGVKALPSPGQPLSTRDEWHTVIVSGPLPSPFVPLAIILRIIMLRAQLAAGSRR